MNALTEMDSVVLNGLAAAWVEILERALAEDVATGDITTEGTVPEGARCTAEIVFEEPRSGRAHV